MLPMEAVKKSSPSTIDDVNHSADHYTEKLWGRNKCTAKRKRVESFSVIRRANASEAIDGTRVRMKEIGKPRYEFEEFVNQVVDKVIDEIEQV